MIRKQHGFGLPVVLIITFVVVTTLITLASLMISGMRLTSYGREKAVLLSVAESGIDDTIDRLRSNVNYTGTTNSVPFGGGSFSTMVATVPGKPDLRKVTSTAQLASGRTRQVIAMVSISGWVSGDGAMISNGDIDISGAAAVETTPTGMHTAHVKANGNIEIGRAVDGNAEAQGAVTYGPQGSAINTVNAAPPIPFPDRYTINTWTNDWITQAQSGGTINGWSGGGTITGPKYINGDLSLTNGETLTLQGSGPIYVNGSVSLSGGLLVNQTHLVVQGTFRMSGQAEYDAPPGLKQPMLVSLSNDPSSAIVLRGGSSSTQQSVVYAVNGGIDAAGNVEFRGAMIAGGENALIRAQGTYDHFYGGQGIAGVGLPAAPAVISWLER